VPAALWAILKWSITSDEDDSIDPDIETVNTVESIVNLDDFNL
jgi:hypothetical protein